MSSLRGHLLIASPALGDPNFARTVILIADHSPDGALGLVLNRPSEATVAESVDVLRGIVDPGDAVFVGGPVQEEAVMVLGRFRDPAAAAVHVVGDIGLLGADHALDAMPGEAVMVQARVFAGHSGWGPGQLDAELAEGAWITEPALPEELFTAEPETLWAAALSRKGGPYALLARMPEDPSVN